MNVKLTDEQTIRIVNTLAGEFGINIKGTIAGMGIDPRLADNFILQNFPTWKVQRLVNNVLRIISNGGK